MTVLEVYDHTLVEINKIRSSTLLLEQFNYLLMKAINEKCNEWYSLYETSQIVSDNLKPLVKTVTLSPVSFITTKLLFQVPNDYWHVTGIIANFITTCNATYQRGVAKLTSNANTGIVNDYYTKPSMKMPYYKEQYLAHSIPAVPPATDPTVQYTDLEIKCGSISAFKSLTIDLDYLKIPKTVSLTYDDLDSDTDTSATMEFSNNYCYEIINKLTTLVLENNQDPRTANNMQINQSMIPPKQ